MMLRLFAVALTGSLLATAGCHSCSRTSARPAYAVATPCPPPCPTPCPAPCPNGGPALPPPPLPPRF